jgi:hypothetical protein
MARRNKRGDCQFRPRLSFEGLETRRVLAADFSNLLVIVAPGNETGTDVSALVAEDSSALVGPYLQLDDHTYAFSSGDAIRLDAPAVDRGDFTLDLTESFAVSDALVASNGTGVQFATLGESIARITSGAPNGVITGFDNNGIAQTAGAPSLNFTLDDSFTSLEPVLNSLDSFALGAASTAGHLAVGADHAVLVSLDNQLTTPSQHAGLSVRHVTIDIESNAFLSPTEASIGFDSSHSTYQLLLGGGISELIFGRFGDPNGDPNNDISDGTLDLADSFGLPTGSATTLIPDQGDGADAGLGLPGIDLPGSVLPGSVLPGSDVPGSDLPPSFGVKLNRQVVSSETDDDGIGEDSLAHSTVTIDIARNHGLRMSSQLGDSLHDVDESMIASTAQSLQAAARVSFRVEPLMARSHRISIESSQPSESTVEMTNEALSQLGSDDLASSKLNTDALDDVEHLIVVLVSHTQPESGTEHHQAVDSSSRNVDSGDTHQSPIALERDATIQLHDGQRSRWQTMVDMLLAGAAGAMVYGGCEDQREVTKSRRDFLRRPRYSKLL